MNYRKLRRIERSKILIIRFIKMFHHCAKIVLSVTRIRCSVLVVATNLLLFLALLQTARRSRHVSRDWLETSEIVTALNENVLRCKGKDMGCFSLLFKSPEADQNKTFSSLDFCLETCFRRYDYGGYSKGRCYCGNSLENLVATKSCDAACSSDVARLCLASSSVRIYKKTITCQYGFSDKNMEETKIGCMKLPSHRYGDIMSLTMDNLTVQQCISHCEIRCYVYAVYASSLRYCICAKPFSLFKSAEGMRKIIQTCPGGNQTAAENELYPVYQTIEKNNFCAPKKFLRPKQGPMTVLASLPGSGNTWLRHLIEAATGIYTGSIYTDSKLYTGGMLGETLPYSSGRTIAIKDHIFQRKIDPVYDSAILLVRNLFDVCLADYTRVRAKSHTETIDPAEYKRKGFIIHSRKLARLWLDSVHELLKRIDHVLVVYYENVVHDPVRELRRIVEFLPDKIVPAGDALEEKLMCMVQDLTGSFKRKSRLLNYNPFGDDELRNAIVDTTIKVNAVLIKRNQPPLPKTYFEYQIPSQ